LEKKVPVKMELEVRATSDGATGDGLNIIAEIPGDAKPNEVVMIGGTGATDNGTGSAVMIEVTRILKQLHLKMDRTVRMGLWSGEEQGIFGSRAYVKENFGDPLSRQLKPAHAKFSGYFNLDDGTGKSVKCISRAMTPRGAFSRSWGDHHHYSKYGRNGPPVL
jgi:Zn-dependent M28 family amino/carboxypeptidase